MGLLSRRTTQRQALRLSDMPPVAHALGFVPGFAGAVFVAGLEGADLDGAFAGAFTA